ncbi:hypothetical protein P8452_66087 [Trifolium repens]|nr:hypothetical protein P8452_66087 [Trifolium repens]
MSSSSEIGPLPVVDSFGPLAVVDSSRPLAGVDSFDTTYRTNNQYRPLAAFMGFDNHLESVTSALVMN